MKRLTCIQPSAQQKMDIAMNLLQRFLSFSLFLAAKLTDPTDLFVLCAE
jgi:hypothetical protein